MAKTYEILKGLPGNGPMYVTVSNGYSYAPNYSEGFVVKFFRTNGEEWVANFKLGVAQLNEVFELTGSNLLVIAGGLTYIMSPDHEIPVATFRTNFKGALQASNGRIVLFDNSEITLFEEDGSFWISEELSLDGLRDISIDDTIIHGQYSDYARNWNWFDFTLNIDTKEITGVKQHQQNIIISKPWWKIW